MTRGLNVSSVYTLVPLNTSSPPPALWVGVSVHGSICGKTKTKKPRDHPLLHSTVLLTIRTMLEGKSLVLLYLT